MTLDGTLRLTRIAPYLAIAHLPDPPEREPQPIIDPERDDAAARYLRRLAANGRAAGLDSVYYDNRDDGHSELPPTAFPQITRIRYDDALRAKGLGYGLAGALLFDRIVIGNSSTAYTNGPDARSLPRHAMTHPPEPQRAYASYALNHIYVYPEHRDHDEADLFPANWPYMLISQGSSYSDRPFLEAIAMTIAAFRPETLARLRQERLLAPTVQMVFRRAQSQVRSRRDYLSQTAHPVVFDTDAIQPVRMMAMAQSIAPEDIPPMVRLRVESETGKPARDEALPLGYGFDTPSSIARAWETSDEPRTMILSSSGTSDPNQRPLQFEWLVIGTDQDKVRLVPQGPKGDRMQVVFRPGALPGQRIDIAVFADNGRHLSAPAFFSVTHSGRI
ncbi:hypothetical protein [Limimaricola litoreus]|uniref:Uncharacterized protein n=1 Tax=Limimaricola litoreus TaxID=2955316 RepID=A0A9X2JP48_9RHOB|nr:hypothetical protein [Limimaricola litoreus]MCP1168389.1 hypothetical protein [Limimaricola litoreus]